MVILQLLQPASASTRRSTALMRVSLTLVRAWSPARMRRQSSRRNCGIRRMLEAAGHLREKTHGAVMVCPRRRRSSLQNLLVHRHFHHECCIYNYNFLNMSHFQTPGGETKGSNSEITGSIWKLSKKICNTQQYYPRIGVWFGWFHRVGNGWPLGLRVLGMGWGWAATVGQGELYLWNTWTWMIYIYYNLSDVLPFTQRIAEVSGERTWQAEKSKISCKSLFHKVFLLPGAFSLNVYHNSTRAQRCRNIACNSSIQLG